jgi:hypothetical protein
MDKITKINSLTYHSRSIPEGAADISDISDGNGLTTRRVCKIIVGLILAKCRRLGPEMPLRVFRESLVSLARE